jgi:hypothetical protein
MNGKGPKPELDGNIPRCAGQECPLFDSPACDGHHGNVCEPVTRAMIPEKFGSALIVTFSGPGSSEFVLKSVGLVSGGQLAALGQSLISRADFMVKVALTEEMEKRREQAIITPGMDPTMVGALMRGMKPS